MLHNIIKTSAVCERMIGHVYHLLSGFAEPASRERLILAKLSREEREHANALLETLEHLPTKMEGYDYAAIVDFQTDFMAKLLLILEDLETDEVDWFDILGRLESLEGSLADNLLLHLKLVLFDEQKTIADRLSAESSNHGKRLREIIESRR